MITLSFTSGEILDIIMSLEDKAEIAEESGKFQLSEYYHNMIDQFDKVIEQLNKRSSEDKLATFVLAD